MKHRRRHRWNPALKKSVEAKFVFSGDVEDREDRDEWKQTAYEIESKFGVKCTLKRDILTVKFKTDKSIEEIGFVIKSIFDYGDFAPDEPKVKIK